MLNQQQSQTTFEYRDNEACIQHFNRETLEEAIDLVIEDPKRREEETAWIVSQFSDLDSNSVVLDYGCGYGRVAKALIERYGCRVIGVDTSWRMRQHAERYVGSMRFAAIPPHEFLEMYAPFGQEPVRFSHVIAAWSFQNITDVHPILRFIKSMLQVDAKLLVLSSATRTLPFFTSDMKIAWWTDSLDLREVINDLFDWQSTSVTLPDATLKSAEPEALWALMVRNTKVDRNRVLVLSRRELHALIPPTQTRYGEQHGAIVHYDAILGLQDNDHVVMLSPFCMVRDDTPNLWDKYHAEHLTLMRDEMSYWTNDVVVTNGKLAKQYFSMSAEQQGKWIAENNFIVRRLDYKFNRIPQLDPQCGEDRLSSYIVNYAMGVGSPLLSKTIEEDHARWVETFERLGAYKFPAFIALNVDGCGLGDVTCCEPVARFAREALFPEDNFLIVTDKPELFAHLAEAPWNCQIVGNNEKVMNSQSYYRMVCFGKIQDAVQCRYLVHSQMHCVDFCSMLAYRRQIPLNRRTIQLSDYTDTLTEEQKVVLSKAILVHPGKHWASKTYPASWWESVVVEILEQFQEHNVVLVGKDISEDQGVVTLKLESHSRLFNFTNQLNLKQFIASVQLAPMVLSNDSAILHIGGAFDNWLFAVLSCKEWEYVMPFRHSNQDYKARMLNDGYIFPSTFHRPNRPEGFRLDDCTESDVLRILPDPKSMVAKMVQSFALPA